MHLPHLKVGGIIIAVILAMADAWRSCFGRASPCCLAKQQGRYLSLVR